MNPDIQTIAFDADDTLWINEPYFRETEQKFCSLLGRYLPQEEIASELFKTEMEYLPLYGYGVKGFVLCMIETVHRVSGGTGGLHLVSEVLHLGRAMLQQPVVLLDGVKEVLDALKGRYRLVMATKGDLLDQERKLKKSGLQDYFHHIEIMSDKGIEDYRKLLRRLGCPPDRFLMLGNSVKSDILPVLELQSYAAHIPYHTTWIHEQHNDVPEHPKLLKLQSITEILNHLVL